MTIVEFNILYCIEKLSATQGLIPRGVTVKQLKTILYDEGMGDLESHDITTDLMNMRRRRLVASMPGTETACWVPTLYGSNVVTA